MWLPMSLRINGSAIWLLWIGGTSFGSMKGSLRGWDGMQVRQIWQEVPIHDLPNGVVDVATASDARFPKRTMLI